MLQNLILKPAFCYLKRLEMPSEIKYNGNLTLTLDLCHYADNDVFCTMFITHKLFLVEGIDMLRSINFVSVIFRVFLYGRALVKDRQNLLTKQRKNIAATSQQIYRLKNLY